MERSMMRGSTLKMAIVLLSVSAMFGMPVAQAQEAPVKDLTVQTDEKIYTNGNKIVITTVLQKHSTPPNALTITIADPKDNYVHIGQIENPKLKSPDTVSVKIGKWSESGVYTVKASYGSLSTITAFEFVSDSGEVTPPSPSPPDEKTEDEKREAEEEREKEEKEKMKREAEEERKKAEKEKMKREAEEEREKVMTCAAGEVKKGDECISICGDGTQFVNGQCTTICGPGTEWDGKGCIISTEKTDTSSEKRGGCLIATAAYGTELAPQLQTLREVRDNTLMETSYGTSFMSGFNTLYYAFSPTIADWERQNPAFASTVGAILTPMISTLSIMNLAEDTNASVLAIGMSVIALNLGIYIGVPTGAIYGTRKIFKHFKA